MSDATTSLGIPFNINDNSMCNNNFLYNIEEMVDDGVICEMKEEVVTFDFPIGRQMM